MVVHHGGELRGAMIARRGRELEGRFGLMLKHSTPFEAPDHLLADLAARMADPPQAATVGLPVGFLVLGQFVVHDLTFDDTPLPAQQTDPDALRNFRTPAFDLDVIYGRGRAASPELYDDRDPAKLRVAPGPPHGDLPRRADGTALIGDPRNDENLLLAQLHVAFLRMHNAVVDLLRRDGVAEGHVLARAVDLVRWHYQWAVVHDLLPRIVDGDILGDVLEERPPLPPRVRTRAYKPKNPNRPFIPLEFSVGAFRFGHSMMPGEVVVNDAVGALPLFGATPGWNLNGRRRVPLELGVDWRHSFEVAGVPANVSRPLDTALAPALHHLPATVVPPPDAVTSLAHRNLLRGVRTGVPSGQAVARALGIDAISNHDLGLGPEWGGEAPLWFYVLKEAELLRGGQRLGPTGGRVVAETLVGLLRADRRSYLRGRPAFVPVPPLAPATGRFGMADLLRVAGVA